MADHFPYTCPFCGHDSTVGSDYEVRSFIEEMQIDNATGPQVLTGRFIVCPNPKCKQFSLEVHLYHAQEDARGNLKAGGDPRTWRLIPPSDAKVFPGYIPKQLRDDYAEACLIRDLSPKASAALARRCLQGMIRDFWRVKAGGRLIDEIEAIKDKVDPDTWKAIDALRSIGNIAAHMEQDVNLVIDVEPGEAAKLIWLIETLFRDWYIHRHDREERLKEIEGMAAAKKKMTQ